MALFSAIARFPSQLWLYSRLRRVTWLSDEGLAACSYPRDDRSLRELAQHGVTLLINLHQRPHPDGTLARYGLTEIHLPVPDFTPPTPAQLEQGIAAIESAVAAGQRVAVHCGAGLGRTGTLLACYLVKRGLAPDEAIARMRAVRPGSVETPRQEAAVADYARQIGGPHIHQPER
jgi:atypical dual specificity phosphatase